MSDGLSVVDVASLAGVLAPSFSKVAVLGPVGLAINARSDRLPEPGDGTVLEDAQMGVCADAPNVAVELAAAGLDVHLYGNRIGTDAFGDAVVQLLTPQERVRSHLERDGDVSTPFVLGVETGDDRTWLFSNGEVASDLARCEPDLAPVGALYVDAYDHCAEPVLAAVRRSVDAAVPVYANLGRLPGHTPGAVALGSVLDDVARLARWVQVSVPDGDLLAAHAVTRTLEAIRGRNAGVVVTMGRLGALVTDDGDETLVLVSSVPHARTAGAGAAFSAGVLAALAAGVSIRDAAAAGARSGTARVLARSSSDDVAPSAPANRIVELHHRPGVHREIAESFELAASCAPMYGTKLLSSHLSMAVVAKADLGATPGCIEEFRQGYSTRLVPLGNGSMTGVPRRSLFGHLCHAAQLTEIYAEMIRTMGTLDALRVALPELLPGIGGAAFHGLIRTAYAVRIGHEQELAAALASWGDAYLELSAPSDFGQIGTSPSDAFRLAQEDLAAQQEIERLELSGNVFQKMSAVVPTDAYARLVGTPDRAEVDLDTLAQAALVFYEWTGAFVALHAVTGTQSARMLLPYLDHPSDIEVHLWHALAAAFLTVPESWRPRPTMVDIRDVEWEEIREAAARSDDEHDAKFVWSCLFEWARTGDGRYRTAAQRRMEPSHG